MTAPNVVSYSRIALTALEFIILQTFHALRQSTLPIVCLHEQRCNNSYVRKKTSKHSLQYGLKTLGVLLGDWNVHDPFAKDLPLIPQTAQVGSAIPVARLGVLSLLCHDGGTVAGGGDGTVTLFDQSGKDYAQTELRGGVVAMSFSPDRTEVYILQWIIIFLAKCCVRCDHSPPALKRRMMHVGVNILVKPILLSQEYTLG